MRHFGFSTGAIAKANVDAALACLAGTDATAVEFSALRLGELAPLLQRIPQLNLAQFSYCSFHAPSRFPKEEEEHVVEALQSVFARKWPIIVHPDTIYRPELWRGFGGSLLIENMDQRKPIGRTADELDAVFQQLPEAGLCFDLAHARQVDPTMTEAFRIIARHGDRIRELHVSDVDSNSAHQPLNIPAMNAFMRVAPLIRRGVNVILEPVVSCAEVPAQLLMAQFLLEAADVYRWKHAQSRQLTWFDQVSSSWLLVDGTPLRVKHPEQMALIKRLRSVISEDHDSSRRWQYFGRSFLPSAGITGAPLGFELHHRHVPIVPLAAEQQLGGPEYD